MAIVKRFEHDSGRQVLAYHDQARRSWFVEEREPPDGVRRHRWCDLTEQQAAETYASGPSVTAWGGVTSRSGRSWRSGS